MARRIGILGGTFDPPHHGHLLIAGDAFEALSLDRLLLIPAGNPPHKPGSVMATGTRRLRMLEAAITGDLRFAVDDREIRREGPSYTVDTLRELRAEMPDAELVFLLGVDQFQALNQWRQPEEIVRLAQLGVFARAGEEPEIVSGTNSGMAGTFPAVRVPVRRVDISATEIRERIALGRSIRYLVPDAVATIIEEERLYRQVRKDAL